MAATGVLAIAAGAARSGADAVPTPDLTVRHMPSPVPTSLAMRGRVAQAAAPTPPAAPAAATRSGAPKQARREAITPGERLEDKIIFRFNIGFGMDAGQTSSEQPLVGVPATGKYDVLRAYGFGDVVAGTRGLLMSSLGTYFAAEFRLDQDLPHAGNGTGAVPSVYYKTNDDQELMVRHGYAEIDGFFDRKWLKPVYVRAGRQFKYSVTVAHFDGVTWGYETKSLSLSTWAGQRVSLYHLDTALEQSAPAIGGGTARVDLYELRKFPLVATYDWLQFQGHPHSEYGLAFRWGPNLLIRASARTLDDDFARETLSMGLRLSEVTTVNFELDNRSDQDWMYDLMALRPVDRRGDPRSYLNLGPVLPRLQLAVRGGTVLLRNLDILLRGAAAIEHADGDVDGPFTPSYVEAGTALEVRLRRNLRVGASLTARRYRRDEPLLVDEMTDGDGDPVPDMLPELGDQVGERSFYESGLGVDYTAGARRFNASAELYSRAYHRQTPYEATVVEGDFDVHSGGRFAVEGWARSRVRIKAEYDVSLGALEMAPELRGVKMLRVLVEGTF
jgi:hypothetical protein